MDAGPKTRIAILQRRPLDGDALVALLRHEVTLEVAKVSGGKDVEAAFKEIEVPGT